VGAVLAQGVDLEVVVVNDGSTDDTVQRIRELGDPRVSVVEGGGNGVAAARNLGIRHARGQWIAFKDDDDRWAPDKLAKQLAALVEMDASWSICGAVAVDETVRLCGAYPPGLSADVARDLLSWNVSVQVPPAARGGGNQGPSVNSCRRTASRFSPWLAAVWI